MRASRDIEGDRYRVPWAPKIGYVPLFRGSVPILGMHMSLYRASLSDGGAIDYASADIEAEDDAEAVLRAETWAAGVVSPEGALHPLLIVKLNSRLVQAGPVRG